MKAIKNWQRYVLEWGILAALIVFILVSHVIGGRINPDTYCPFGGIQAFANLISHGSLPCDMSSLQILSGIALLVAVVLFSKLFCAYLCSLGTISDLCRKLRDHFKLKSFLIQSDSLWDKTLRIIKYILLFVILYGTITTGELVCKKIDPYYALATGFKGELVLWMSVAMALLLILGSLLIDNFWCKYICPLGAISNTFKYWLWMITVLGASYAICIVTKTPPMWCVLAMICAFGYLLEILNPRTSLQLLYVQRNKEKCNGCHTCNIKCPYHINIAGFDGAVENVDCMLCGECVANCPTKALRIGVTNDRHLGRINAFIPAILTVVLFASAILFSRNFEIPTINETWNIENTDGLQTFTMDGLRQVRCYASSRAFMDKLQKVEGVYGVKTYVKHQKATILYNSNETTPEKIQESLFVSAKFQIVAPDYKTTPELVVKTIRTENMTGSNAINLLGLQFKQLDSLIYGLRIDWDIPLSVRMYVDPAFDKDEQWIKNVVELPFLDLKNPQSGKITQMPLGFKFVRMEPSDSTMRTVDFLGEMFKPFMVEFKPISEVDSQIEQFLYEIPEENITKPVITRNLPLLVSYLRDKDGIGAVYSCLNEEYTPCLVIRYYYPMTDDELYRLMSSAEWRMQDKEGERYIHAPFRYIEKGSVKRLL